MPLLTLLPYCGSLLSASSPQFPPPRRSQPQPLTPQPRKTKASSLSHLPGGEGWDEPQRKSQKSMGVTQCGSLLSKSQISFSYWLLFMAFRCLQTVFCFLHFYLVLVPTSYSFSLSQPRSASLSLPTAPKPSLLPSHCSYLSLSSQGEPGPKGDPGEKSHWVSSSPALTSRCPPCPGHSGDYMGWGSPSNPVCNLVSPGESLARSQPLLTPSTLSLPSGQGQPYKQTYTLCLRHCLCLLSAAFAGQGDPAASSWVV